MLFIVLLHCYKNGSLDLCWTERSVLITPVIDVLLFLSIHLLYFLLYEVGNCIIWCIDKQNCFTTLGTAACRLTKCSSLLRLKV